MSFNGSEERIVKSEAHGMANLDPEAHRNNQNGIVVSNVVEIVHEDKKKNAWPRPTYLTLLESDKRQA